MIRPTKGLTPIYVHYFDNQSATIYNLTEEQYNHIIDTETALITFLNQINREYKARWERDPLGGEGAMEWFQDHVL